MDQVIKVATIPTFIKILYIYAYPLVSDHKYIRFLRKNKLNSMDLPEMISKL